MTENVDPDLLAMAMKNEAILNLILVYLLTDKMDRKGLDRAIVLLAEKTDEIYVAGSKSELLRQFLEPLRDSFNDVANGVKQLRAHRFSD